MEFFPNNRYTSLCQVFGWINMKIGNDVEEMNETDILLGNNDMVDNGNLVN